jgi:prepilin-type N-terminal cleavage/methylation domain-containing protein
MRVRYNRAKAFTLLEVIIVLAIIGLIVAIAAATWFRQREISRGRACQENLTKISDAKEQYAMEFNVPNGSTIAWPDDLLRPGSSTSGQGYLKKSPACPASGVYSANVIGQDPTCSIGANSEEEHIIP